MCKVKLIAIIAEVCDKCSKNDLYYNSTDLDSKGQKEKKLKLVYVQTSKNAC